VKCSLLTLSTFIDGELAADRRAELDAHLVGCARCSAGAATLREEKRRLGQLARVRVDPSSARLMLEQVGISGVIDLPGKVRPAAPTAGPPPDQQPWQSAQERALQNSAALPWTPRRPAPAAPAVEAIPAPPAPPDIQPDLPFVAIPAEERPWMSEPAARSEAENTTEVAPAVTYIAAPPQPPVDVPDQDYPWAEAEAPSVAWDAAAGDDVPPWEGVAAPAPPAAPPPPIPPTVPTRIPSTGGSMLWSRLRDAVAVRLTLARHTDTVEDSILIVSGATPPRGRTLPAAEIIERATDIAAEATDVELTGFSGVTRAAPVHQASEAMVAATPETDDQAPPAWTTDEPRHGAPSEPVAWNAFGASSYPPEVDTTAAPRPPTPARPASLGRHSRAVAREQVSVATRMRRAFAATAVLVRESGESAAAGARTLVKTARGANPDRRIMAAIAAVAIIFITALVIGHRSTPSSSATAGRAPAASAPAHASTTAPTAPPAPHAPAVRAPAVAAALPGVQTFGAGATGFQVRDLRYGQQARFMRIVFDMGPVSGSSGTSPRITVSFTNPTTLLVTLNGTLPAGTTGNPPAHSVISSVTLVSSSGGKTVYRIVVTHPVTATGLFLSGTSPPLRFVLDLH
jgi:Putative zinc-finger